MGTLLGAHDLSVSFGLKNLFQGLNFTITDEDRIGLIGPNGAGKSTLLKILSGDELPDEGYVSKRQGLKVGFATQSPEFPTLPLEEVLVQAVKKDEHTDPLIRARTLLSKAQFTDFRRNASELSGGWKKRLDLLRALMQEPDLLLLDEPTNHLDLEGILWLEKFLNRENCAYVIVSHDRYFLENVANKVIEINPCYPQGLLICEGGMTDFITHKEAFLEAQKEQERSLKGIVKSEIDWLRKSPKARTTKSTSRVQNAYKLIDTLAQIKKRNVVTKVSLEFTASERETRKLLAAKNLSKTLGGKLLFKGLDVTLSPGTRLGIVGRNGTGKTTLLKILAGVIPPDTGTLKFAQDLQLVYFDQHREQISPQASIKEALSPTSDYVNYRGQQIHVNGWAKKFLFEADRLNLPVACLSGGERARIQIAHLMLKPADILFLDEPTNDLDIPTLEIIEESLQDFPGAVVLISHDRCLMDRVCTQIVGLGTQDTPEFFADYSQWEASNPFPKPQKTEEEAKPTPTQSPKPTKTKKLTYMEQRELEGMEQAILNAEEEIDELHKELESNTQPSLELYQKLGDAQANLETLYSRWQILLDKTS